MYQSLYRKYRPASINDIVGQKNIVRMLENSIKKDKISHAYLFCGPRGTGKTSMAKIFARAINCESSNETTCGVCANCQAMNDNNHPDIVEIDAASNNGVDEIRSLIERVKYTPILGRYKVYIIDEVHMLSQGAFNALLKTLEEPPSHVVFILATTEIHKVLPTIISRCQRFDFSRIANKDIAQRLDTVLKAENVKYEAEVPHLIASISGGGLRNALTILEQAIVMSDEIIKITEIYESHGIVLEKDKIDLFDAIINKDIDIYINKVTTILEGNINIDRFMMGLVENFKDTLILIQTKDEGLVDPLEIEVIKYLARTFSYSINTKAIELLINYADKMKFSQNQAIYLELSLLELFNTLQEEKTTSSIDYKKADKKKLQSYDISLSDDTKLDANDIRKGNSESKHIDNDQKKSSSSGISGENEEKQVNSSTPLHQQKFVTNEVFDFNSDKKTLQEDKTEVEDLTVEAVVQFMVTGDKALRVKEESDHKNNERYKHDLKWAKLSRILEHGSIVVSGPFFTIFKFDNAIVAREVMEEKMQLELIQYAKVLFGISKPIYAISSELYLESVKVFIELNKENRLPEPLVESEIKPLGIAEVKEENNTLTLLDDLFGESLKIIE